MCAASGDALDHTVVERRDPLLGTVLDKRFRIESQIAAGGFGAIYRATDVHTDDEIALKVLLPQLARDPSVVARFRREGKTLASLRDPHTITAYELGEAPDGTLYIVMELLHGESLYHRYKTRGPLSWRQVIHIALGVCSSLAEAHAAGVVHRDLKPANIHLENRPGDPDFVKVLDFGIAKIVQGNEYDRTELTQAGTMIGTVDYMSPEQMVGGDMTPASDVYTLGVVMYEMIAGRTPFAGANTATAILAAVLTQTPEPLSRHADVPERLVRIVARCLGREAAGRYASVELLAEELAEVAGDSTTHRQAKPSRRRADDEATVAQARLSQLMLMRPSLDAIELDPAADSGVEAIGETILESTLDDAATGPAVGPAALIAQSAGFEQPISTTESTRIDVRISDSAQPVFDARGRRRIAPATTPPPPPTPSSTPVVPPPYVAVVAPPVPVTAPPAKRAKGSQLAIDARAWQPMPDSRGALPAIGQTGQHAAIPGPPPGPVGDAGRLRTPTPPPPLPVPVAQRGPVIATPLPGPPMLPPPGGVPSMPPFAVGRAPVRSYGSYDMTADASRDTLVRRIIWIALLIALGLGVLIATR